MSAAAVPQQVEHLVEAGFNGRATVRHPFKPVLDRTEAVGDVVDACAQPVVDDIERRPAR